MDSTDEKVSKLLGELSPAMREITVGNFADEFNGGALRKEERIMAEAIFRASLRDDTVSVRQAMSDQLKRNARLPHDVAIVLAKDVADVALPIVRHSPVLTDSDLVGIVETGELEFQLAVAKRKRLTEPVSDALIDTEVQPVVGALMGNAGAEIAPFAHFRVMNGFATDDQILGKLVRRPNLPFRVVRELMSTLDGKLLAELEKRHPLPANLADDLIKEMSDEDILDFIDPEADADALVNAVQQLNRVGRLSPPMVVQSLCLGDFNFFESAISELTDISQDNLRKLIFDEGPLGLQAIQKATKFPKKLIEVARLVIQLALKHGYDGDPNDYLRFQNLALKQLDTEYDGKATDNLGRMLVGLCADDPEPDGDAVWSSMARSANG